MLRALLVLCVVLASQAAASASAQPSPPARDASGYRRSSAALYRYVAQPGKRRAEELARQALSALQQAMQTLPAPWRALCERTRALPLPASSDDTRAGRLRALVVLSEAALLRRASIDSALARLDVALTYAPDDPGLLYTRAQALSLWEEPKNLEGCDTRRRDRETAQTLERLSLADPTYHAARVAFDLGVARTRERDFDGAALAYGRAIALSWDPRQSAVTHANLAEVTMLAGQPARAVVHYERAIALARGGRDYPLSLLGLSVALERLGEHEKARDSAVKAVEASGRTLAVLDAEGVFFEPPHERHYYRALGHEALAQLLTESRASELGQARAEYEAFLEEAPEDDLYQSAARASLSRVAQELRALPAPTRTLERLSKTPGDSRKKIRPSAPTRPRLDAR